MEETAWVRCADVSQLVRVLGIPSPAGGVSRLMPPSLPPQIASPVCLPGLRPVPWPRRLPLLVGSPQGRRLRVDFIHDPDNRMVEVHAQDPALRSPRPVRKTQADSCCKLKGVTHAPAFRVHSTALERVAVGDGVSRAVARPFVSRRSTGSASAPAKADTPLRFGGLKLSPCMPASSTRGGPLQYRKRAHTRLVVLHS